jgi:hypothetical protein
MKLPELWQRFAPHIGNVPGQVGMVALRFVFQTCRVPG